MYILLINLKADYCRHYVSVNKTLRGYISLELLKVFLLYLNFFSAFYVFLSLC